MVSRVPQPQYLAEYIELLRADGRTGEAAAQRKLLASERKLMADNGVVDDLGASNTPPTPETRPVRCGTPAPNGHAATASSSPTPSPGPCT